MKVVADLHLHSKYSRAVSQQMTLPEMAKWAKRKGIDLLGTGDFTHPLWFRELKSQLEEAGEGIYKLKSEILNPKSETNSNVQKETLFLLSTEISSIYSQGGRLRRIHNLIFAPSLEVVEKINAALLKRGANLMSDGRPIIGLSARDLVELVLSVDENCLVVPAHCWTPWFSLYGSESGFDSINECFGEMVKRIFAVETGLSSDPAMNWRITELDSRAIISFSDAHSPAKLGREATILQIKPFDTAQGENEKLKVKNAPEKFPSEINGAGNAKLKISYSDIAGAIRQDQDSDWMVGYTIEFYPEEGKYHFTGHRNCNVRQSPEETQNKGSICPVCGKGLTVGVMHRVEQLAKLKVSHFAKASQDRQSEKFKVDEFGVKWIRDSDGKRPPYVMLVPLLEIIAESLDSLTTSQRVINEYNNLTDHFGSELKVLLETSTEELAKIAGERLSEAVERVRQGEIVVEPGYDGEYGVVKIWSQEEVLNQPKEKKDQLSLF